VPVLRVFDGDGFLTRVRVHQPDSLFEDLEIEAAVRFGFVDAPELEQPGGPEAKAFLTSLIGGRTVWIDILVKMDTGRSIDKYGRIVCVPYLQQEYSGCLLKTPAERRHRAQYFGKTFTTMRNIELEMVLNGWAWVLDRYGPDDRYFEALDDARRNKRGIWADENSMDPWRFKQLGGARRRNNAQVASLKCPVWECGGTLRKRQGRFGEFLGCSNYPTCNYARAAPKE